MTSCMESFRICDTNWNTFCMFCFQADGEKQSSCKERERERLKHVASVVNRSMDPVNLLSAAHQFELGHDQLLDEL